MFIGYGCIIMPGVTIGNNVVVGAGALVTKDIPSDCVAAGVPARVLKHISEYQVKVYTDYDATKLLTAKEKRKYYLEKYDPGLSVGNEAHPGSDVCPASNTLGPKRI